MNRRIDISYKTVFFITGFLGLLWALYQIRQVIVILFIAIIFMSALSPLVERLEKLKIPKGLAIAFIYVIILGLLVVLVSLVVTPLADQTRNLIEVLPGKLEEIAPNLGIDSSVMQQELGNFSKNAFTLTIEVFNNFIAFVSVAVLTFYLLLQRDNLDDVVGQFFVGKEERIKRISHKIEEKLGAWMRGQIVLSLIVGILAYIVLLVLNIPYALPLAILAAIMEVVPVIGPIISAIPAILLAYLSSPLIALIVGLSYLVIQQIESHVVVPQVMKKAVGLNPLVVILAVAIGGRLLGVAGALLAVPITVVIQIITQDIIRGKVE